MEAIVNNMPATARVWIYQGERKFSPQEKEIIDKSAANFVAQWAAHGKDLAATYRIEYDQFLIFMVDETQHAASGCSIDSSVALIREIEKHLGISMLDRSKVAFLKNEEVSLKPFNELKRLVESGEITEETLVFDNSIDNLGEWQDNWLIPAGKSWLKRYF